jgi:serine phosphatase RsbU (regulator of sigma subunit)/PAS domain-containing protein
LTDRKRQDTRWLALGVALATSLAVVDIALGGEAILIGLLVVVPLLVAAKAHARATAFATAYSVALALLLGIPDMDFGQLDHLLRIAVVLAGGSLAIWIASLRERTERAEQRATFIAEAGTLLDTSLDFDTTVRALARIPVPWLADWCAVYVLTEEGAIKQLSVAHSDPSKETLAWELERRYPFHLDQPVGLGRVIRTGAPELMQDILDEAIEATVYDDEHARMVRGLGLKSAMFVPLRARGRTLGALAFATADSDRHFGSGELALAESLADRAALALDNAELYTKASRAEVELRRSADELEAVFQGVASAITVRDPTGKVVYANEAAAHLLGFTSVDALLEAAPENILERFEVFDEDGQVLDVNQLPGRVALTGVRPLDAVVCLKDKASARERWTVIKATPILDEQGRTTMAINIFDDITSQKRAELSERFLSESSKQLVASLDYEATLDTVAHLAVPHFADWCAVDITDERGSIKHVALAHVDPSRIALVEEMRHRYPVEPESPGGVAEAIRTGEARLYPEVEDELLVESAQDESHLSLLRSIGLRSAIVVPMVIGGKTIGALTFCTAETARRYDERDLELGRELGRRAAAAVENARLYAERSHIAQTLQRSLLPPVLPEIPGIEVAARFRPAGEGYEVGGDFYDVFNTGGGGWGVVIGDVCGKGAEAAALTGLARHTLRAAALQEEEPTRILELLSEAIRRQRSDSQFCTAAYGRLELGPVGARIILASGGHPLPLLLSEDGEVDQVGVPGTLLGSIPEAKLFDQRLDLRPGATLVFYTDGVIEAGKPRGAFGLGGLTALLGSCAGLGAQQIAERIDNAVVGLGESPADDVAVLVLRIRE